MINRFRGEYAFLSNFYESPITYNGITFGSSEAAFQAQKCFYEADRELFRNLNPSEAKKLGRKIHIIPDWEYRKDMIMYRIVLTKFASNDELRKKLIATGKQDLIEGNTWGDTYWGWDENKREGKNRLGEILKKVREDLSIEWGFPEPLNR